MAETIASKANDIKIKALYFALLELRKLKKNILQQLLYDEK